ncbi:choice-of-anchor D domain-containing protein [bacterium]|nr:choice-of-anchor D domain-containing protein [bacterium]
MIMQPETLTSRILSRFKASPLFIFALSAVMLFFAASVSPVYSQASWPSTWIPMVGSDWNYMTDPAGDHNPASIDVVNNGVPLCCYYASSGGTVFFRMALGGDPLNQAGELDQYAWAAQIDVADDGNSNIDITVRAEGINERLRIYNGAGAVLWNVDDPIANHYISVQQSGTIWYLDMQAPYSGMNGIITADTPIRFFFHTSTTETNDIKDATVPSTTISGAFAESGTTTLGSVSYGFMYDTRDPDPYSNAGTYYSGETVSVQGYGWPGSRTLNVRIRNAAGTIMWTGTVSTDGSGNVGSTTAWTVDYSSASGIYTIQVQHPNATTWSDYDDFTVVLVTAPEINVVGNSISIADGDNTPSTSDHTDFGTIDLNTGTRDYVFTIQNIGNTSLTLSGSPVVEIGGTNPGDFTVTEQATSPVAAGSSVTFTIRFDPSAEGLRSATVSISNDDSNENPYDFTIQGTGALLPEIDVTGNGISIANGDNTPNSTDETDFGDVPTVGVTQVHTFRIANSGSADLNLSGSPMVVIGGAHASDFTVTQQPSSPVSAGSYTTFVITFDPVTLGIRSATVTIANNDLDENPYVFSIQGTGISIGNPFPCSSRFYHIYGGGTIAYPNTGSDPFTYSTAGYAGSSVNAVGFNREDNMLYANTGSSLIRIDAGSAVTVLSVSFPFASYAGDCDDGGNYYFINASNTQQAAKYDVDQNTVSTISLSASFAPEDMAYISGSFYGVSGTTLYRFNPSGNTVTTGAITGTLADESGLNGGPWSAAWTASDGYLYVVNQTSHRFYKIDVATGLSFYEGRGSGSVSNSDGASCHQSASPMPANGSAGNFVWADYDNDGIQDSGEPGLSGVTVTLYRRGGTQTGSTTSNSAGAYSFSGLTPEQYYLTFTNLPANYQLGSRDQGGDDALDSDPDPATGQTANFIIDAYDTDNTRDAACVTTGVGDRVWSDQDGDGIQDSGEPGVANVTVNLQLGNGTDVTSTTTDANGRYQFIGLTAGTSYQLVFSNLPGGYDFTTKDQGGDDALDSDVNGSTAKTGKFTAASGVFDPTQDAGLVQTVFPEINITGNYIDIADGDNVPSTADGTDFGSATVASGTVDHSFTIQNTGGVELSVSVSISGTHAAEFSVITSPMSPVSAGDSTTFTVRFDPNGPGTRSAVISISNNDPDENPYDFAVQGTGLAPEIDLQGNGNSIPDGDNTPDSSDDTDFGPADMTTGTVTHTFTIANAGTSDLSLTGTPVVQITGTHASDFTVTQQPASGTVTAGGSVTFEVTFDPGNTGLREAEIIVYSSDSDEGTYNFSIQGTGTAGPEMDVQGKGVSIADGDVTPSTADDTNFGTVNIDIGSVSRTFTIINTGNSDLSLTGSPIVSLSTGNDFTVSVQPASSTVTSGGGSVTFVISFNPASVGAQTAIVTIANTDADENPYTFTVGGTGVTEPEMDVLGNGTGIPDGDVTPDTADDTDWDTVDLAAGAVTHTFTILNEGNADLLLSGTPLVAISGSADFTVSTQPASSTVTSGGGTITFAVSFDPSGTGIKTATISIDNNDPDEHPYTFTVQGEGVSVPEMNLSQGGTPVASGGTYTYANTEVGSYTEVVFTIDNAGSADLTLTTPLTITGADAGQFSIEAQPAVSTVNAENSTTFTVRFTPASPGAKTATISIANNDSDENPYVLVLNGTGTMPEITLLGNGTEITDGDNTPDVSDDTEFGSVEISSGAVTHTFTIRNDGNSTLSLTGTPLVTLSGSGDFTVSTQPASSMVTGGGGTVGFVIGFDPSSAGLKSATVSIASNDSDENPYTFDVQGTGTVPEMDVVGNGIVIDDGDNTPDSADHTDFGSIAVSDGAITRTFTIRNDGTGPLSLTGTPIVTLSGSGDFTVSTQPASSTVASGGGTVSFVISFDPSSAGSKSATVSIANNDPNENPYDFAIEGTGEADPAPVLVLSKTVDKFSAAPGENLTYTITYENTGNADATAITILEQIPANTVFVQGSVTASGMTVLYSHNNGVSYDASDAAPVTHIRFQRAGALSAGSSGSITFRVQIN